MMALVEPPTAMSMVIALSKDRSSSRSRGQRFFQTISTIHRPVAVAILECSESIAGMEEAPGSVSPSVSAIAVMVDAVPMVMQWPGERAMLFSMSFQS